MILEKEATVKKLQHET